MGCDRRSQSRYLPAFPVSIHAPTWGATNDVARFDADFLVSIHAPTWGATSACLLVLIDLFQFQSTHPHGVRHHCSSWQHDCRVSIHAPTWGATPQLDLAHVGIDSFNPRTHMGCDSLRPMRPTFLYLFQSTHPHGVRRKTFRLN